VRTDGIGGGSSASDAALEALSRWADSVEERLSREAEEIAALRAFTESAQKDSTLALEWLSQVEADITRLTVEVEAL
jgi:hypothetical protein